MSQVVETVTEVAKPWLRAELDALKTVLAGNKKGTAEIKKIRYCVRKIEYMLERLEKRSKRRPTQAEDSDEE